jgi:ankyrin repeat protein
MNDSDMQLLGLLWDAKLPELLAQITQNPKLVDHRLGDFGETLLHRAAGLGDVQLVKALIAAGSDVSAVDRKRDTSLHWAVRCAYADPVPVVHLLVKNGAAINVRNNDWESPIMIAASYSNLSSFAYLYALGAETSFLNRRKQDISDLVDFQMKSVTKSKKYDWQRRSLETITELFTLSENQDKCKS